MADNKANRGPLDRNRVNVNEDYELRYWAERFSCSPEQLKAAVKMVGPVVGSVEQYLSSSR